VPKTCLKVVAAVQVVHRSSLIKSPRTWLIYRQQLFYPYSAWASTIGRAAYQPKMQPDDRGPAILKRLSPAAIDANKSFDALGI
jgi:hypothetical protein